MKKLLPLMMLMLSWSVTAQAEVKIAVVDQMAAIINSEEAKVIVTKIRAGMEKEQAKGVALQKSLETLKQKYERDSSIMGQDEVRKLQQQVEDKQMEGQFLTQKLRKRQKEGEEEIIKAIGPKFRKAIKDVKEEGGYDIILQRQAAIDLDASFDITAKVTEKINSQK